jgi:hypothetical protein
MATIQRRLDSGRLVNEQSVTLGSAERLEQIWMEVGRNVGKPRETFGQIEPRPCRCWPKGHQLDRGGIGIKIVRRHEGDPIIDEAQLSQVRIDRLVTTRAVDTGLTAVGPTPLHGLQTR